MKEKHKNTAIETGQIVAKNLFEVFSEPKNRAENFTWEDFPRIASRFARNITMMNFGDWDIFDDGYKNELKVLVAQQAEETALQLIKDK